VTRACGLVQISVSLYRYCLRRADCAHPNMLKVLDAIIELKLPVALYWDASCQKRVAFK
jgi:hypothetical protein